MIYCAFFSSCFRYFETVKAGIYESRAFWFWVKIDLASSTEEDKQNASENISLLILSVFQYKAKISRSVVMHLTV